jgi:hypothetical protein
MRPAPLLRILALKGRESFTTSEAAEWLDQSVIAARATLRRLKAERLLVTPVRGFWVVVRPEEARRGGPAPVEFLDPLMRFLGERYAIGLLSGAALHGVECAWSASLQVMAATNRRPLTGDWGQIDFFVRSTFRETERSQFSTRRGVVHVAALEEIALDLIGSAPALGGLPALLPVIDALAPKLDAWTLIDTATRCPLNWSARLGFVLEHLRHAELAGTLLPFLNDAVSKWVPLDPTRPAHEAPRNRRWHLLENVSLPKR